MIVCRLFGREVFAVGRERDRGGDEDLLEHDREDVIEPDLAGGQFELDGLEDEEGVYLRRRRQRPPVVVVGGKPGQRGGHEQIFGFARPITARSCSQ